jgi:hypothetical protein
MAAPTQESGVSRPSTACITPRRWARYDIFGSERYVLTTAALRDAAQYAPYEFIEILVNNDTYGGGIFGQFSTAAANNDWANYLFVHEFGHHFAGLADEYYTSPVAYQSNGERQEPWEPNATALRDPSRLKWKSHVRRRPAADALAEGSLRQPCARVSEAARRPARGQPPGERDERLVQADLAYTQQLFSKAPQRHAVGAFEGANYESSGYYRPECNASCSTAARPSAPCARMASAPSSTCIRALRNHATYISQ